jgi:hypothetical protein
MVVPTATGIERREREISTCSVRNLRRGCSEFLCVQRQTAAVRMFLRFFRLSIFAFKVGKRHVE